MTSSMSKISRQELKILSIIIFVASCGMLGLDIHLASLPHIMEYMHTNKQHMQQSVSIFLLGMGCSLLFYGPLSDRFGRKPIIIIGLLIAAIFSYAGALTTNVDTFLATRLFQGIGAGVCMGLGRTVVADVMQGDKLAAIGSYLSMFLSLSPLFAPALGGYIQQWLGWQANFITLGGLLTIALVLYAVFCPETNKHKNPKAFHPATLFRNYLDLIRHPIFIGCTLLTGIAMAANMVYCTSSSFILQGEFHISVIVYGWLTAAASSGGFIGKFCTPFFIRKLGSQQTIYAGTWLIFIAGLGMIALIILHLMTVPLIIAAVFLTIFAQAMILPNSAAKALSPFHDKRGAAGALYGGFQLLTAFVVSAAIASIPRAGISILAYSYIALGIAGIAIYLLIFHKSSTNSKSH